MYLLNSTTSGISIALSAPSRLLGLSCWLLLLLGAAIPAAFGQQAVPSQPPSLLQKFGLDLFWDSEQTSYNPTKRQMTLTGDVVFIGDGNLVAADHIILNLAEKSLEASGHVVLISSVNSFTGDKLKLFWETGDFEIKDAAFRSNDPGQTAKYANAIMGFTAKELAFEQQREQMLAELGRAKLALMKDYGQLGANLKEARLQIAQKYATILAREDLIKAQPNPFFKATPAAQATRRKARRRYWQQFRRSAGVTYRQDAYFKIEGKLIKRVGGNDFRAEDALWTPCQCDDDESPAWGFRNGKLKAQIGGYVTLYDPILEIKGIPVLYLPFLKLPIKHRRQSGFLPPSVATTSDRSGFIYSQPVFFDLRKNLDATMTTNIYQERGTRFGLNLRYASTRSTGWEGSIDTIRDRMWREDVQVRRVMRDSLDQFCQTPPAGQTVAECLEKVRGKVGVPENTWRGSKSWRGLTFFTPRLSLVSHGRFISDKRFDEDYLVFNPDTRSSLAGGSNEHPPVFATSKIGLNLDGRDLYLGLFSLWGNDYGKERNFEGLQMPALAKAQTRLFPLTENFSWLPTIYLSGNVTHATIRDIEPSSPPAVAKPQLSHGFWQRAALDIDTPIYTSGLVQVYHRSELESRRIFHSGLTGLTPNLESTQESTISSVRNEVSVIVPIDSKQPLPKWLQPKDAWQTVRGPRYFHHFMEFELGLTSRPFVSSTGPYLDRGIDGQLFTGTYFDSDTDSTGFDNEQNMVVHNKIFFQIRNRWKLFREAFKPNQPWEKAAGKVNSGSYLRKAQSQLQYHLGEKPLTRKERFLSDSQIKWPSLGYVKSTYDYSEPLTYDVKINYDFEKQRRREESVDASEYLPSPWEGPESNLTLTYQGFQMNHYFHYDMDQGQAKKVNFSLRLPSFYETSVGFSYSLLKEFDRKTKSWTVPEYKRSISLFTKLIPRIAASYSFTRSDSETAVGYNTNLFLDYVDPSQCWGLSFHRFKDRYDRGEESATYTLALYILFLGNKHVFDNIFKPVERHILQTDDGF